MAVVVPLPTGLSTESRLAKVTAQWKTFLIQNYSTLTKL